MKESNSTKQVEPQRCRRAEAQAATDSRMPPALPSACVPFACRKQRLTSELNGVHSSDVLKFQYLMYVCNIYPHLPSSNVGVENNHDNNNKSTNSNSNGNNNATQKTHDNNSIYINRYVHVLPTWIVWNMLFFCFV